MLIYKFIYLLKKGIEPLFYHHEWYVLTIELFQFKLIGIYLTLI